MISIISQTSLLILLGVIIRRSCIEGIERYKLSKQFNQVKYGNNSIFLVTTVSSKTIKIIIYRLKGKYIHQ